MPIIQLKLFGAEFDKRLLILSALLVMLCAFFWMSSRYPELNTKAMMGDSVVLEDGLSFESILERGAPDQKIRSIVITFINWIDTNKKGMLFGLSFATVLLAMFPLLKPMLSNGMAGLRASLTGTLLGAPLGVCVNCAAPIAFGLYRGGARAETVLSTMISSPTLNIVVLSMTITLFPYHIALTKIALTIVLLLLIIPVLVWMFPKEARLFTPTDEVLLTQDFIELPNRWSVAIRETLVLLGSAARQIFISMIPLMLLAGLLGAIVVTLLPWEDLSKLLPSGNTGLVLIAMLALAVFGLVLPVPMAFDVIIVAMLLGAGLSIKYASTLLFVLGSFSVYSWLVLYHSGAVKLATSLAVCIVCLGMMAGLISHFLGRVHQNHLESRVYSLLLRDNVVHEEISVLPAQPDTGTAARPLQWLSHPEHDGIEFAELSVVDSAPVSPWRMVKKKIGFKDHALPMRAHMNLPFVYTTTLAAADVNSDGHVDVLVSNLSGAHLYLNTGGKFTPAVLSVSAFPPGANATTAAFADLNSDGQPDLVYAVGNEAVYYAYNDDGVFLERKKLTNLNASYVLALAFGDLDGNGDLDVLLGRHDLKFWGLTSHENSKDQLFLQDNGHFHHASLPDVPAETLSILLSDLNGDGFPERLHASEFEKPDNLYWGLSNTSWKEMNSDDLSVSSATTMSIDSADINNDLMLDFYQGQITFNSASPPTRIYQENLNDRLRQVCVNREERLCHETVMRRAWRANGLSMCGDLGRTMHNDCIANSIYARIEFKSDIQKEDRYLEKHYPELALLRHRYVDAPKETMPSTNGGHPHGVIPVNVRKNLLHVQNPDNSFDELGEEMGVAIAGWTWNAQFADLDGDGYQDLFTVNGWYREKFDTENVWYQNIDGTRFINATKDANLRDLRVTMSALQFDIDNDGDLDVLTLTPAGEVSYYENSNNPNRHLQIELTGIDTPVGVQVIIEGKDGTKQLRELKSSGGFQSYGPQILHFGLSQQDHVKAIEVKLLDGRVINVEGTFLSGRRYRLRLADLVRLQ